MIKNECISLAFLVAAIPLASSAADTPYRKPPAAISAVLDAPVLPVLSGNAERDVVAAHRLPGVRLSAIFRTPFAWLPGSTALVVQMIPARGAPPQAPQVPSGPVVQESSGSASGVATYEDLLANSHDEALFDYYARSQLAIVDIAGGPSTTPLGKPAIITSVMPSVKNAPPR